MFSRSIFGYGTNPFNSENESDKEENEDLDNQNPFNSGNDSPDGAKENKADSRSEEEEVSQEVEDLYAKVIPVGKRKSKKAKVPTIKVEDSETPPLTIIRLKSFQQLSLKGHLFVLMISWN